MPDRPRYSITPAGASTDPHLEGNDLRVLCFLGEHTDRLGWCFLSQVKMAAALRIGRATLQRSLGRLAGAGYVEVKSSVAAGHPHACHAYRVIMDRDDPEVGPSEYEVEDQQRDGGCPPAGTPAHQRAGVPALRGQGVPIHTRAQNDPDSGGGSSGCARAREVASISSEAQTFALELAAIAGHDPDFLPPKWISDGPAARVQMMFDRGWQPAMMRETAQAIMRHKRDGPPLTIRYFERPFARAHADQSRPAPLPEVAANSSEHRHAAKTQPADGWRGSRDRFRDALADFGSAVDQRQAGGGGTDRP